MPRPGWAPDLLMVVMIRFDSQTRGTSSLVRDGQTSPHRPRLVVSRSTCPPPSQPPPHEQLCNRYCSNKHTHTCSVIGLFGKSGLHGAWLFFLALSLGTFSGCPTEATGCTSRSTGVPLSHFPVAGPGGQSLCPKVNQLRPKPDPGNRA